MGSKIENVYLWEYFDKNQQSDAEKNGKHKKIFPGKIYTRFCHLNAI